jgi:hypothetical protein
MVLECKQEFDYNKILDEIYPLSKSQVTFFHNPVGFKKGTIMASWTKMMHTNGAQWALRKVGISEDEIWNRMKPMIRKRILENFENLITWTDYVGNDFILEKYRISKERDLKTKKRQIVIRDIDTLKPIQIFDTEC